MPVAIQVDLTDIRLGRGAIDCVFCGCDSAGRIGCIQCKPRPPWLADQRCRGLNRIDLNGLGLGVFGVADDIRCVVRQRVDTIPGHNRGCR